MTYEKLEKAAAGKERREKLTKLFLECGTWDEFRLKRAAFGESPSKYGFDGFKIVYDTVNKHGKKDGVSRLESMCDPSNSSPKCIVPAVIRCGLLVFPFFLLATLGAVEPHRAFRWIVVGVVLAAAYETWRYLKNKAVADSLDIEFFKLRIFD